MFALSLSLAACVGWGVADFLGGLKSRRLPALAVLFQANLFGMLSIVAVVGALYPVVTVLLAAMVLGERPQRLQWLGVGLAVVGIGFIST